MRPVIPRFGPSPAPVTHPDHSAEEIEGAIRGIFGRPIPIPELSSLVGAPGDSRLVLTTTGDRIYVSIYGKGYNALRVFQRSPADGVPEIINESSELSVRRRGQGEGTAIFGRQVENATRFGITRIRAEATRSESQNGYYTWPRFGWDGPIPEAVAGRIAAGSVPVPPGQPGRLSDLMATQEGRDWWKAHGDTADVTFDLAEGSLSRTVWEGYLAERAAR